MSEIKLNKIIFEEDISKISNANQDVIIEQISDADNVSTITANNNVKTSYMKSQDTCTYFMAGIQEMVDLDKAAASALTSSDAWGSLQIKNGTEG